MSANGVVFKDTFTTSSLLNPCSPGAWALRGETEPFPFFLVPKCRSQICRWSGNLSHFSKAPCSRSWAEAQLGEGHSSHGSSEQLYAAQDGGLPALCGGWAEPGLAKFPQVLTTLVKPSALAAGA